MVCGPYHIPLFTVVFCVIGRFAGWEKETGDTD